MPSVAFSASFSAATCASESGSALVTSAVTSPRCAATQPAEGGDDVGHGEEPPVGGGDLDEVGDDARDAGLVEDGGDGARLLLGASRPGSGRSAARSSLCSCMRGEAAEIGLDRGERLVLGRKLEQGGGVALRDT